MVSGDLAFTGLGTADAMVGAGEGEEVVSLTFAGKLPTQPVAVKINIKVNTTRLQRYKFWRCMVLFSI